MDVMKRLASLLKERNDIDYGIAEIVGRPAEKGHVGEYIASKVFGLELESSATTAGYDGRFSSGPLAGKTANVKWYAKREGILDVNLKHLPDFFLVLAGPVTAPASTAGTTRPWVIAEAFLFETSPLIERLNERGVKIGTATSVIKSEWETARVYPKTQLSNEMFPSSDIGALALFR